MANFSRSREFEDMRSAHRAERAPSSFKERLRVHFDVAASTEADAARRSGGWLGSLGRWPSPAALCVAAGAGALLIWAIARPLRVAREGAETPHEMSSAPSINPAGSSKSGRPCPLQELPRGAFFDPTQKLDPIGVSVHTFEVVTPSCGPLVRHYHELVPASLVPYTSAPIVIALHDRGRDAGWLKAQETRWYFDALARREGLILIYANAAPSAATSPRWSNSGGWQTDAGAHPQIDDEEYLARIVEDLTARGVVSGTNDVFLVGVGSGATMALVAAANHPERYAGVAAFMPSRLDIGVSPDVPGRRLSRVLIVTQGLAQGGSWQGSELEASVERWAAAVGVRRLPSGALPAVRRTSSGGLVQFDLSDARDSAPGVRVLALGDRADPFPPPGAADPLSLEASRRRPDFIDGAEQAWRFLGNQTNARVKPRH